MDEKEGGDLGGAYHDPFLGLLVHLQTEGICSRRSLRPPPATALSPPLLISNFIPCAHGHTDSGSHQHSCAWCCLKSS